MSSGSRRLSLFHLLACCGLLALLAPSMAVHVRAASSKAGVTPTITLATTQPGNIYAPGQTVTATVTLKLPSGVATTYTRVESMQDYFGAVTPIVTDTVTLTPNQPVTTTVTVPVHGSGYFELDVTLTPPGASAPIQLAALPIGVLRPHAPPTADSPFATIGSLTQAYNNDPKQMATAAQSMAAAGIGYTREELNWQILEHQPGSGQFDFTRTDQGIIAAHNAGLHVLGLLAYWGNLPQPDTTKVVSGTQTLNQVTGCSKAPACAYTPQGDALFARYAAAMVARYKPGGSLAQQQGWSDGWGISNWEVWNEPSTDAFWRHDLLNYGQLFAQLYTPTAAAIHAADPNAKTMYTESGAVFDQPLAAAGATHDILAVHTYTGGLDPDAALVQPTLPRGGQGTAPADIGALVAQGAPVWITETGFATNGTVTAHQQASYLARTYANFLAAGVKKIFWFKFHEDSPGGDNLYSIVNRDFSPKPAYLAYATLTDRLNGATFAQSVMLGSAIKGDVFNAPGGGSIAMLWSTAESGAITVSGLGAGATAYDLMDNPTGQAADTGMTLPLSGDPVFLSVPGVASAQLSALLRGATVSGINPAGVAVSLAPGLINGLPNVKVTVSARTTATISGTVALQLPSGWAVATPTLRFPTLAPGQSSTLSFRLVSAVSHIGDTLTAVVTTRQGATAQGSTPVNVFGLTYGHPAIDGTLATWARASEADLINLRPDQVVGIPGWTPRNLSAKIYTMWDQQYFYLAADVTDQTIDPAQNGYPMYNGDSMQLGWGMDPAAWNNDVKLNAFGIAVALTTQGSANYSYSLLAPWPDMKQVVKLDPRTGHLIYTMAIPWSRLGSYVPAVGKQFVFNLIINQKESGNRIGWIQFTPGIGLGFYPSQFNFWTIEQGNPAAGLRLGAGAPLSGTVGFTLPAAGGQLTLHDGGLQAVNLTINGTPLTLAVPARGHFGTTTFDLSRYLHAGANTVTVTGVPAVKGGAGVLSFGE